MSTFHAEQRVQPGDDFDQVRLVAHHLGDVLVRARDRLVPARSDGDVEAGQVLARSVELPPGGA
ncbi:hypothetical protein C5E08_03215 [Rathayibacter iranicus]|uniref:Uncharacterized protein n=1 Tax=Rathayibacter iranicus TaxID=59737 RepID=A0AAD1ELS9_9MICO|nr:hypothetical protein C7V51_03210 [Rathayibacter iranicus]PPI62389.1 hypothetical protein C5E08_03215 [Rathayibacter iranicus]